MRFQDIIKENLENGETLGDSLREAIIHFIELKKDVEVESIDDLDEGFSILFDLADTFTQAQIDAILDEMAEILDVEYNGYFSDEDEENDDEEYFDPEDFKMAESVETLDEDINRFARVKKTSKFKRYARKKNVADVRLKGREKKITFKLKNVFDTKQGRYVKRKKALNLRTFKKKARIFKRTMKRRRH